MRQGGARRRWWRRLGRGLCGAVAPSCSLTHLPPPPPRRRARSGLARASRRRSSSEPRAQSCGESGQKPAGGPPAPEGVCPGASPAASAGPGGSEGEGGGTARIGTAEAAAPPAADDAPHVTRTQAPVVAVPRARRRGSPAGRFLSGPMFRSARAPLADVAPAHPHARTRRRSLLFFFFFLPIDEATRVASERAPGGPALPCSPVPGEPRRCPVFRHGRSPVQLASRRR